MGKLAIAMGSSRPENGWNMQGPMARTMGGNMPIKSLVDRKIGFLSKQANVLLARIRVMPDHHSYLPGGTIRATIRIHLKKPLEARSLSARLYCVQTSKVTSAYVMDSYDYQMDKELGIPRSTHIRNSSSNVQKVIHSERKKISGHSTYQSGDYVVEFPLPHSAPRTRHSFGHDGKKAIWKIDAKLDVPLAPDISATKEIAVE